MTVRRLGVRFQNKHIQCLTLAAMTVWLAACGSAGPGSGGGTTNPTAPTISSQPSAQTVTAGQTATFTVSASGTAPLTYQWSMNSAAVGTNSNTFTIVQAPASDNAAQIFVTISNTAGMVNSNTVMLTVNPVQASTANVLTF